MGVSEELLLVGTIGGAFLGTLLTFTLLFYILTVIAAWRILNKAGEKGWKSLIPIYNIYMLYKVANFTKYFWLTLAISVVSSILKTRTGDNESLKDVISIISGIVIIVINACFCSRFAKSFGKGKGFAVGLFFFPNIFQLILGFGSAEYTKIEE